jgi:LysR family transcriptional regulator, cyn operon transcriptional activator
MDLRQLEMFLAVAENMSFTKAGEKLYVAQSAISRKISMLEDELGELLFKRVNKRIYLTPAGETLLRYARRTFQDLKNATLEISEMAHLKKGKLKIGAGMIACIYILPPVLERFKARFPAIDVEVVTDATESLLARLRQNDLDLGLFVLPIEYPDVEVIPIVTEEMVVVTSRKHPLAGRTSIRAEELSDYPLILFEEGTYTRRVLDGFFRNIGITPKISMEAENVAVMKPFVRINLGIGLMPLPAVVEEAARKELHYLRIRDYDLTRQLGLVFQKVDHLPRLLSELIVLFREELGSTEGEAASTTVRVRGRRRGSSARTTPVRA